MVEDESPRNGQNVPGLILPSTPAPSAFTPTPTPTTVQQLKRTPFFEAQNASRYARQALIKNIEKDTGTRLICYVSAGPTIERLDVVCMVDLLHNIPEGSAIDLLLHSPGGDIDAAEKLITLIRKRAGKSRVRVIVPDFAKSAATLIALGADEIVMSDASELGAIDPQVELTDGGGNRATFSAQSYLDAFDTHSANLRENPDDPVARLMLDKMEPVTVRKLQRITTRSRSIAADLLGQAMVPDQARADEIATTLSDTSRWHSHGQMISHEAAVGVGLTVKYFSPESNFWQQCWRLYCLQLYTASEGLKIFESSIASIAM